jgi:hypothetical protein
MRQRYIYGLAILFLACNKPGSTSKKKGGSQTKEESFNTPFEDCVSQVEAIDGVSQCLQKHSPEAPQECVRAVDQMKSKRERQDVAQLCCELLDRSLKKLCYGKMGL